MIVAKAIVFRGDRSGRKPTGVNYSVVLSGWFAVGGRGSDGRGAMARPPTFWVGEVERKRDDQEIFSSIFLLTLANFILYIYRARYCGCMQLQGASRMDMSGL